MVRVLACAMSFVSFWNNFVAKYKLDVEMLIECLSFRVTFLLAVRGSCAKHQEKSKVKKKTTRKKRDDDK